MRYFYLDTTSSYLYTAIVENNKIVDEVKKKFGRDLSAECLSEIEDMFNRCNLKPNDIDKIILVNGPGSFTGCRIGITIAKTMAWGLKIPITTISSLEAMALNGDDYSYHIPLIDARRDYVFAGIYDQDNNEVLKGQYLKRETLEIAVSNLGDEYVYITNDDIKIDGKVIGYDPDIIDIVEKYKDKETINPHAIDANYLKLTEAEEKLNA